MKQQPVFNAESLSMPLVRQGGPDTWERNAVLLASVVLYSLLLWVCWPILSHPAIALGDQQWMEAFGAMPLGKALLHVGTGWYRPGENLLYWLISHSSSLLPWRTALLGVFLLTAMYLQYDTTVRNGYYLDGFGAALAFSFNPTTLSVPSWLSASHVSLCTVGILWYFSFARRALHAHRLAIRHVVLAWAGLAFALAFYELALFAPVIVVAYRHWVTPDAQPRTARLLDAGAGACIAMYLGTQLLGAHAALPTPDGSAFDLTVNSMRYAMQNYYLWFNPFDTFGVLIQDRPATALQNAVYWLLMLGGAVLAVSYRKTEPLIALGGLWFSVFLIPVGTLLAVGGHPIAEHHIYLPLFGVAAGAIRIVTRFVEQQLERIRHKPARILVEGTISVVLLWSLGPLVDECRQSVELWGSADRLYLRTLENYPDNIEVLSALTDSLCRDSARDAATRLEPTNRAQTGLTDTLLMRTAPEPAAVLLEQGQALAQQGEFVKASSTLARAFVRSESREQQRTSGLALTRALSHTALRARAQSLRDHLLHELGDHEPPAPPSP